MDTVCLPTFTPSLSTTQTDNRATNVATEADNLKKRRETFVGWNGKKNPVQLAIAGFCYTGSSDKVVCPTCNVKLYNWEESENAIEAHRTNSPNCAFIKKWYNVPANTLSSDIVSQKDDSPKYPSYKQYQSRLDSYFGWPLKSEHQNPRCMATEGFFYVGSADRARCFQCGLTLRDWDDDDVPFDVHLMYSPVCEFVKERQRQRRLQLESGITSEMECPQNGEDVCNGTGKETSSEEEMDTQCTGAGGGNSFVDGDKSGGYGNIPNSDQYSPMIEAVLEFGFSIDVIQKAMEDEKMKSGRDFKNAEALLRALTD